MRVSALRASMTSFVPRRRKKSQTVFVQIKNQQSQSTLTSKTNATKRNVIALVSDDAIMSAIYHSVDICHFVHLVIGLGF